MGTPLAHTLAATTANGIPMMFVWEPGADTVRYYDRRYAGQPGFTDYGQQCGPDLSADSFQQDATHGIRGWHEVDAWDIDARTVRLVAAWLHVSGCTAVASS